MSKGTCRFCGEAGEGPPFTKWVKPTFTNYDLLHVGDIACNDCLFWFDERSSELAQKVGKAKPQRMRNYSHFVKGDEWTPLSKRDKTKMKKLILTPPFPELAVVAESGQKHIVFRATRNPRGEKEGWVQFEEHELFVVPDELRPIIAIIESLLLTFSKQEIETADYLRYRVRKFRLVKWLALETVLKRHRGSLLFSLALFLSQKQNKEDS